MICIYHNDADGHCAAAIVAMQIANDFEPKTFIEYGHQKAIELDEEDIHNKERVMIVDLALDEHVMQVIRKCLKKDCDIIHIDHHIGGKEFEKNLSERDKILYERVTNFYRDGVSACMLTYVYSSMTMDEQLNPNSVEYDFMKDYTHFAFYPNDKRRMREYGVPDAVRYINDHDVWTHQFDNSRYFVTALRTLDTQPLNNEVWEMLLYERDYKQIASLVDLGRGIAKYQKAIYEQANHNGFETEIDGFKGWVVNCPIGNSLLFGDKYIEYDFVCKFSYDGSVNKWQYSFYSNGNSHFNCAEICQKYFNGNGHAHAASGFVNYNFFHRVGAVS